MTTAYGHLNDPNTKRLATNCCVCNTPLRDAKSVEMGIGPVCRKKTGYAALYKTLDEAGRIAVNKLIHRAGLICEAHNPDVQGILDIAQEVEDMGFVGVSERILTRFVEIRFVWVDGVTKYRWDGRQRREIDTGETHDVLRVWTPYSPRFVSLRRDRRLRARPVKTNGEFFWEFPKSSARDAYQLVTDVFKGRAALGAKGFFIVGEATE